MTIRITKYYNLFTKIQMGHKETKQKQQRKQQTLINIKAKVYPTNE